jgi:hypothetical protein
LIRFDKANRMRFTQENESATHRVFVFLLCIEKDCRRIKERPFAPVSRA